MNEHCLRMSYIGSFIAPQMANHKIVITVGKIL